MASILHHLNYTLMLVGTDLLLKCEGFVTEMNSLLCSICMLCFFFVFQCCDFAAFTVKTFISVLCVQN